MVIRWLGIYSVRPGAQEAQEVRLQVLTTTDLHGHILPQDSYTLQPANQGWARLATLIRGLRAANPNTVLVDCGDATQGEPINYVWSRLNSKLPEPSMAIMNSLGYNAMVVGGQEFDHGLPAARHGGPGPVPLAGGQRGCSPPTAGWPSPPTSSWTWAGCRWRSWAWPGPPRAARPGPPAGMSVSDGLVFQDPVAAARAFIPLLREKEKVDMVVVALHGGAGKEPCPGGRSQAAAWPPRCRAST